MTEDWIKDPGGRIEKMRNGIGVVRTAEASCLTCVRYYTTHASEEPCSGCIGAPGLPAWREATPERDPAGLSDAVRKNMIEHHLRHIEKHTRELRELLAQS